MQTHVILLHNLSKVGCRVFIYIASLSFEKGKKDKLFIEKWTV